ncbi:hypothetical protein [Weissella fangxianensis]|nr:hypothetical protein [Weissella fangxianensis]
MSQSEKDKKIEAELYSIKQRSGILSDIALILSVLALIFAILN